MTETNQKDPETISLDYPVEVDGRKVSSLTFRRMKVRDQMAASEASSNPARQEIHLAALISGESPKVIEEMDMTDFLKCQRVLVRLQGGPVDFLPGISNEIS